MRYRKMRAVLDFQGERYVLTYPCKGCGAEIDTAELCAKCAKGNDPFKLPTTAAPICDR